VWTPYGAQLAQWWPRVGAMLLDGLLLGVPTIIINAVLEHDLGNTSGAAALEFVLILAIQGVYFGTLNGTGSGQTLGNKAAGIAVRDAATNMPIGYARGFLRWFVRFALYLFVLVPGVLNDLWPLWNKKRQTIADQAARSVMIRVR
jgi:uncharacterized RDD family membrane protein YckC